MESLDDHYAVNLLKGSHILSRFQLPKLAGGYIPALFQSCLLAAETFHDASIQVVCIEEYATGVVVVFCDVSVVSVVGLELFVKYRGNSASNHFLHHL